MVVRAAALVDDGPIMAPGARQKFVFAVLTIALLFAAAEGAARIAPRSTRATPVEFVGNDLHGPFPSEFDPDLFWRIPANSHIPDSGEAMNARGLRGPDFTDNKPAGARRILCVGDSNTFGIGVSLDETFAHRLQRWLSTRGLFEVINCGVPGYSSFQMLQFIKLHCAAWKPDLIILYCGAWNDYTPAVGLDDEHALKMLQNERARGRSLLYQLELYHRFARWCAPEDRSAEKRKLYIDLWSNEAKRPDGPRLSPEQFRNILNQIVNEAKLRNAPLVAVVPPAPRSTRLKFTDGELYANIVREAARDGGAGIAEAREALSRPESGPRDLFADVIHPAPLGHAIITKLLAEQLIQNKFVSSDGPPPEAILGAPIDLKYLQKDARNFSGEGFARIDGTAAAARDPVTVALELPHRIEYINITIPPAASLLLEPAVFIRAPSEPEPKVYKKVGPVDFKITITTGDSKSVIYQKQVECDDRKAIFRPPTARVDLAAFAGKNVMITFEASGPAFGASWGLARIQPFR